MALKGWYWFVACRSCERPIRVGLDFTHGSAPVAPHWEGTRSFHCAHAQCYATHDYEAGDARSGELDSWWGAST